MHYNSTLARWQPVYYDAYIQGTINDNNFVLPYLLLSRKDYGVDQKNDYFNTTVSLYLSIVILICSCPFPQLPEYPGYFQANTSYLVWAFITFHEDPTDPNSALEVGGTSAPIGIDLS